MLCQLTRRSLKITYVDATQAAHRAQNFDYFHYSLSVSLRMRKYFFLRFAAAFPGDTGLYHALATYTLLSRPDISLAASG